MKKTLPDNVEFNHYRDMFKVALIGIKTAIVEERNMCFDIFVGLMVVVIASILKVSKLEWCLLILMIGLVLMAEIFNTAIENIVDFICPHYDLKAKKIKDLSCGAVLVICMACACVGLLIFIPYL